MRVKLTQLLVIVLERAEAVDETLTKTMPKHAQQRRNVANELLATESRNSSSDFLYGRVLRPVSNNS